jgi:hypothetical protein
MRVLYGQNPLHTHKLKSKQACAHVHVCPRHMSMYLYYIDKKFELCIWGECMHKYRHICARMWAACLILYVVHIRTFKAVRASRVRQSE